MKLFKQVLKLELDFLVKELKTLHKMKKINEYLDKSKNNNKITQPIDNQVFINNKKNKYYE